MQIDTGAKDEGNTVDPAAALVMDAEDELVDTDQPKGRGLQEEAVDMIL